MKLTIMTVKKYQKIILVVTIFVAFITAAFGQSYQLQLHTSKEDSFLYRVTETTDFYIKSNEGTEQNKEQKIVDYQFVTTPIPRRNIQKVTIAIKNIVIEKTGTTQNFSYDAKGNNPSSESTRGYDQLINHNFDVEFNNLGKLRMISDFNAIFDEDFSSADVFDNTNFEVIKQQMKEQFSNNTFENTMRFFQYCYQKDSVLVGDSWMVSDSIYPNFGILSDMTYTLKEVKNNIALIDIKSNLRKDPNFKGIDMNSMHLKFNLEGQQEGLVLLDMETGWIRKMSIAQKLAGKMTVFFIDPQGVIIKIRVDGTTDYDLINY